MLGFMEPLIEPGFFSNTPVQTALLVGGVVAVVSGIVGTFTVMRGQSFAGHSLADIGTAGGSASFLLGISPLFGFVAMNLMAAGVMEWIGIRRPRGRDLATGIVLGAALGLAALFAVSALLSGVAGLARGGPAELSVGSLVGAGALTFLAYSVTGPVVALVPTTGRLVPLGFATLLIGFFAMAVRRKAVSQIVGLLIVNNGIALVAFLATSGFPLVVELGASLDVLLVVVLLRVMASQMGSKFGVLDLDQLRELHD